MAFGRKKRPPSRPLTNEELIARHQALAEEFLRRSAKGGRLEAETRYATMATAHATLAVSYQLAPPAPDEIPALDETGDEEEDESTAS